MQPTQKLVPITVHNSPTHSRPNRSKSRLLRQNRPIYLTDGQISSSDHTNNVSCSEISMIRIQYESKMRKLQRENKQLREIIVTLKASQYYQVDQQRIKTIIRQNQSLKLTVTQLQNDIKLLDQQLEKIMVESQYLKKSNVTLKHELEVLVKQSVRERHNYMTFSNSNNNGFGSGVGNNIIGSGKKVHTTSYGDEQYDQLQQVRQAYRQELRIQSSSHLYDQHNRDTHNNKVNSCHIQPIEKKHAKQSFYNKTSSVYDHLQQQPTAGLEFAVIDKPVSKVPIANKVRNKSRSNRSSSKSNDKLLLNALMGQKSLTKRHKKQSSQIPSTAQSQNIIKHYKSTTKLRGQMKSRQSHMLTSRSPNPYDTQGDYMRKKTQSNTNGPQYNEDYYVVKRQVANKAKKNIYYI